MPRLLLGSITPDTGHRAGVWAAPDCHPSAQRRAATGGAHVLGVTHSSRHRTGKQHCRQGKGLSSAGGRVCGEHLQNAAPLLGGHLPGALWDPTRPPSPHCSVPSPAHSQLRAIPTILDMAPRDRDCHIAAPHVTSRWFHQALPAPNAGAGRRSAAPHPLLPRARRARRDPNKHRLCLPCALLCGVLVLHPAGGQERGTHCVWDCCRVRHRTHARVTRPRGEDVLQPAALRSAGGSVRRAELPLHAAERGLIPGKLRRQRAALWGGSRSEAGNRKAQRCSAVLRMEEQRVGRRQNVCSAVGRERLGAGMRLCAPR